MKINLFAKTSISCLSAFLLLSGCTDTSAQSETKPKIIKEVKNEAIIKEVLNAEPEKIKKVEKNAASKVYTQNDNIVYEAFQDSAKIGPKEKQMILVFGTNTDPYTDQLKKDIKGSPELQKRLKNEYSSYYLKAHENLRHKLFHENEYMDVDTKTMISIYGVNATPTMIFADKNGKAVLVVPGYMPANQFIATMDFMKSKKWEGKDRKNGEVYQALKDFYIQKGIIKKKG